MDDGDQAPKLYLAYHAAGHFVAHRYLLPHDLSMTVSIAGDDSCKATHQAVVGCKRDDLVEEKAVVLYAGVAAERLLGPSRAKETRRIAMADVDLARDLLVRSPSNHVEEDLRSRAAEVVSRYRTEIESLASELVEWKTLDNT